MTDKHFISYIKSFSKISNLSILVFFIAWLNPVLRASPESPLTLFRLLSPFLMIFYYYKNEKARVTWLFFFCLFFIYNLAASLFSNFQFLDSQFYIINYFYIFLLFAFSLEFFKTDPRRYLLIMPFLYRFLLIILYISYFFSYFLRLLKTDSLNQDFYINTIYTSPNDLALAIGSILVVIMFSQKVSLVEKISHFSIILFINFQNDSKAILIAQIILLLLFCLNSLIVLKLKKIAIVFFLIFTSLMIFTSSKSIMLKDGRFSLNTFFIEPISKIILLEPYSIKGSLFSRTDATIYLLKSYMDTGGLGIGAGNSLNILAQPEHSTFTALSAHNFLLEWIVEFGWLALICIFWIIRQLRISLKNYSLESSQIVIAFTCCLPFFSLSQSSGYISNYIFWLVTFYIYLNKQHSLKGVT